MQYATFALMFPNNSSIVVVKYMDRECVCMMLFWSEVPDDALLAGKIPRRIEWNALIVVS